MSELYRIIEDMLHDGRDVETIARAVSKRRNELRLEADANDPEALALTKKSNLETYGDCPIDGWDEQAWCLPVTQVTVYVNGSAEFLFRGENRITVK